MDKTKILTPEHESKRSTAHQHGLSAMERLTFLAEILDGSGTLTLSPDARAGLSAIVTDIEYSVGEVTGVVGAFCWNADNVCAIHNEENMPYSVSATPKENGGNFGGM